MCLMSGTPHQWILLPGAAEWGGSSPEETGKPAWPWTLCPRWNKHKQLNNFFFFFVYFNRAHRFTDRYLGVKLTRRLWLQVVVWGSLVVSSPESGVTLNTWRSFSSESKHRQRSNLKRSHNKLMLFLIVVEVTCQGFPVGVCSTAAQLYFYGLCFSNVTKPKAEGVSREAQSGQSQTGTQRYCLHRKKGKNLLFKNVLQQRTVDTHLWSFVTWRLLFLCWIWRFCLNFSFLWPLSLWISLTPGEMPSSVWSTWSRSDREQWKASFT